MNRGVRSPTALFAETATLRTSEPSVVDAAYSELIVPINVPAVAAIWTIPATGSLARAPDTGETIQALRAERVA